MSAKLDPKVQVELGSGMVIPACPLALTGERKFDEWHQRALFRYYFAAGAGGLAVGVHTTQFAIRDPKHGLFKPLLQLAQEEFERADAHRHTPHVRVGGICGNTEQALSEAMLLRACEFHAGLLSLSALKEATEEELITHCKEVGALIPLIGFYLQPAVGGRTLSYAFWRRFAELPSVAAIKVAPFNRYQTLDVVRAVAESGREDIALYTGNDDNIVHDLITPYQFNVNGQHFRRHFVGGLLGHWSVWTRKAVSLLQECHEVTWEEGHVPTDLLRRAIEVTDTNAAFFDAANGYAGCIAGLHEVLRRQGLMEGIWCLDPDEGLSRGQMAEIDRVYKAYPHLNDDEFVMEHLDDWLKD